VGKVSNHLKDKLDKVILLRDLSLELNCEPEIVCDLQKHVDNLTKRYEFYKGEGL